MYHMKLLITGIEGYIGSVLRQYLNNRGHDVYGIDTGYYTDESNKSVNSRVLWEDIRNVSASQIAGYDAVIHLSDLSNDPLGMIDESITREINYEGTLSVAKKAKQAGVKRYIYSSSCSVYGNHDQNIATETSPTAPQTMYARCKRDVERELVNLCDSNFTVVILRNSTVYGMSPSMRFDLVINKMVADAYLFKEIIINNNGDQWRPLAHILDVCHAFTCCVEAPDDAVRKEIFNVGSADSNCRIADLGNIIHEEFPESTLKQGTLELTDKRSYKVSFDKIHERLPGFHVKYDIRSGIRELHKQYIDSGLTLEYYQQPKRIRMKQILNLIQSHKIDNHYYWINSKTKF